MLGKGLLDRKLFHQRCGEEETRFCKVDVLDSFGGNRLMAWSVQGGFGCLYEGEGEGEGTGHC